jgi:hypothetical protein
MQTILAFDTDLLEVLVRYLKNAINLSKLLSLNKTLNARLGIVLRRLDFCFKSTSANNHVVPFSILPGLIKLMLSTNNRSDQAFWSNMFSKFERIEQLCLIDSSIIDNKLDLLATIPNLQVLKIDCNLCKFSGIQTDIIIPNLTELDITISELPKFNFAPKLDSLTIRVTAQNDDVETYFLDLPQLEHLTFIDTSTYGGISGGIVCNAKLKSFKTQGDFKIANGYRDALQTATTAVIQNDHAKPDILKLLSRNVLNNLQVSWLPTYANPALCEFINIEHLKLTTCEIDFATISNLPLKILSLFSVTIRNLSYLGKFTTLGQLAVLACRYTSFDSPLNCTCLPPTLTDIKYSISTLSDKLQLDYDLLQGLRTFTLHFKKLKSSDHDDKFLESVAKLSEQQSRLEKIVVHVLKKSDESTDFVSKLRLHIKVEVVYESLKNALFWDKDKF